MRKLLCSLIALGAISLTLPAGAQTIAALSVSQPEVVGGQSLTGQVALSAPLATNGGATSFSLSPAVVVSQSLVTIPAGSTSSSFRIQTLPVDTPVTAVIGIAMAGSTQFA